MSKQEMAQIELAKTQAVRPTQPDRQAVVNTSIDDADPSLLAAFLAVVKRASRRYATASDSEVLHYTGVTTRAGELTLAGLYALGLSLSQKSSRTESQHHRRATACERSWRMPWSTAIWTPITDSKRAEIRLLHDRLVITSPGGLWGVSESQLSRPGAKSAVNPVLHDICTYVGMPDGSRVIEGEGGGIREAIEALRSAGLRPPRFIDIGVQFTVVISRHTLVSEEDLTWLGDVADRTELSSEQRASPPSAPRTTEGRPPIHDSKAGELTLNGQTVLQALETQKNTGDPSAEATCPGWSTAESL